LITGAGASIDTGGNTGTGGSNGTVGSPGTVVLRVQVEYIAWDLR
jgi:hypothetical protein